MTDQSGACDLPKLRGYADEGDDRMVAMLLAAGADPAVREECYIEIVSYGGDTTGYQIPFNVHYTGVKTKGTFDPATKKFTQA